MTLSVDNCVEILNDFFKQYENEEKKIKQVVLDVAKTAWKKHGGYGIYGMFSTQHTQREDEVDTLIKNLESSEIDQWTAIKSLGRQGHWNKTGYGFNSYSSYNTKLMLYLLLEVCKIMEETTIGEIITKSPHKFEEIAQLVFNRLDTLIAKKSNKITEPDATFLNYKDVLDSQTGKLTYD